jgi:hypothetical protein
LEENDILFYLDSKYYFVEPFTSLYEDHFRKENQDILVWKNKPNEEVTHLKNFCKPDVLKKYQMDEFAIQANAECCWAGAIMIKKTVSTVNIVKEWLSLCCVYENISYSPGISSYSAEFIDLRHDQSLLCIVLHKHNRFFKSFPNQYLQNVRKPW